MSEYIHFQNVKPTCTDETVFYLRVVAERPIDNNQLLVECTLSADSMLMIRAWEDWMTVVCHSRCRLLSYPRSTSRYGH